MQKFFDKYPTNPAEKEAMKMMSNKLHDANKHRKNDDDHYDHLYCLEELAQMITDYVQVKRSFLTRPGK